MHYKISLSWKESKHSKKQRLIINCKWNLSGRNGFKAAVEKHKSNSTAHSVLEEYSFEDCYKGTESCPNACKVRGIIIMTWRRSATAAMNKAPQPDAGSWYERRFWRYIQTCVQQDSTVWELARMHQIDSRLCRTKLTATDQHRPTAIFSWIGWVLFKTPRRAHKLSEVQLEANCNLYVDTRLRCWVCYLWEFKEIGYWYEQAALVPTSLHSPHTTVLLLMSGNIKIKQNKTYMYY